MCRPNRRIIKGSLVSITICAQDLHARLRQHVLMAKGVHARSDKKGLRARMTGIRRLKGQVDRIDTSLVTIENNIDEIINSDVTKDIINSLQRSTEAMRNQGLPMGGIEGVQETMDDLQSELTAAQEVTDAIHRGMDMPGAAGMDDCDDDMLLLELDSLLLEDDGSVLGTPALRTAVSPAAAEQPPRNKSPLADDDDSASLETERVPLAA